MTSHFQKLNAYNKNTFYELLGKIPHFPSLFKFKHTYMLIAKCMAKYKLKKKDSMFTIVLRIIAAL